MDSDKLMEKMLEKLDDNEETMKEQIVSMGEIIEKSNNVLLQIETGCLKPAAKIPIDATAFTYNKDNLHALATILESFQSIGVGKTPLLKKDDQQPVNDFEIFLQNTSQRIEIVGGSVRKLLAINETVSKMKNRLEKSEDSQGE